MSSSEIKNFGIIGWPVGHSLSPQMYMAAFKAAGFTNYNYTLLPTQTGKLYFAVEGLKGLNFRGVNVTIPHKSTIMQYLDAVDSDAMIIGAVNTVVNDGGILTGYNTDWSGFLSALRPLLERHIPIEQALVLGTGGAARAVTYALHHIGIHAVAVSRKSDKGLTYSDLTADTIQAHRLIVNCTPLGMSPHTQACPDLPYDAIGTEHILFDCIYNPAETLFLSQGRQQGATTLNGMTMLEQQAEQAWQLFRQNQNENQTI